MSLSLSDSKVRRIFDLFELRFKILKAVCVSFPFDEVIPVFEILGKLP